MKISLEHSKFLWIISAIFRSPAAVTNKTGMKRPWEQPKFVQVILEILWLPSQPTRKSAWNIQKFLWTILAIFRSPAKIGTKISLEHSKVLMDYIGNLQ